MPSGLLFKSDKRESNRHETPSDDVGAASESYVQRFFDFFQNFGRNHRENEDLQVSVSSETENNSWSWLPEIGGLECWAQKLVTFFRNLGNGSSDEDLVTEIQKTRYGYVSKKEFVCFVLKIYFLSQSKGKFACLKSFT